jgi:sigma-E factor negative regulatory protein RseA
MRNIMGSVSTQAQAGSWQERVSAALDGESCDGLAPEQLVAGFSETERVVWSQYHMVGDALRSDDLAFDPNSTTRFMARFSETLALEAHVLVPAVAARSQKQHPLLRRFAPGAVIAVAAASLTWIAVPQLQQVTSNGASGGLQRVAYTQGSQGMIRDADLDQYLAAHEQFSQQPSLASSMPFIRTAVASTEQ